MSRKKPSNVTLEKDTLEEDEVFNVGDFIKDEEVSPNKDLISEFLEVKETKEETKFDQENVAGKYRKFHFKGE